jgi:NAD(P)-dependent dehydrogenase (short-subunit alcohol dehydrogenase family)
MADATRPMAGRVVIVTGASAGIGKATAEGLAALGARVVVPFRDEPKCRAATEGILRAVPYAQIEMVRLDLASLDDVRRFATEFAANNGRLDVLINNAAVVKGRRELTVDGLEETFAVNVLAPFLLSNLLLPHLRASAPSRIINLSSGLHKRAHMDLDDLQLERGWSSYRAYDRSKLADILLTVALAERLRGTGVTANSAHPGLIDSDLGREMGWAQRKVKRWISKPAGVGARTSVYLASSPEVEGVTGRYFVDSREAEPSEEARDKELAERLWRACEGLAGLKAA